MEQLSSKHMCWSSDLVSKKMRSGNNHFHWIFRLPRHEVTALLLNMFCALQVTYTCAQQKAFGQCGATFMNPQLGTTSFCAITCGRCPAPAGRWGNGAIELLALASARAVDIDACHLPEARVKQMPWEGVCLSRAETYTGKDIVQSIMYWSVKDLGIYKYHPLSLLLWNIGEAIVEAPVKHLEQNHVIVNKNGIWCNMLPL